MVDPERESRLEEENERLRHRVAELESEREAVLGGTKAIALLASKAVLGQDFWTRLGTFAAELEKWQAGARAFPAAESVLAVGAAFRRFVRVGLVGLLLALMPFGFSCAQTFLQWRSIETQLKIAQEQNEGFNRQSALLQTQADVARQKQLEDLRKELTAIPEKTESIRALDKVCRHWLAKLKISTEWTDIENAIDLVLNARVALEAIRCEPSRAPRSDVGHLPRLSAAFDAGQEHRDAALLAVVGTTDATATREWLLGAIQLPCADIARSLEECGERLVKASRLHQRLDSENDESVRRLIAEPDAGPPSP